MLRRISEPYRVRESMDKVSQASSAGSRNKVAPATPATVTSSVTPVTEAEFIAEERRSGIWYIGGSEDTESTILPGNEDTWADSPEPSQLPVILPQTHVDIKSQEIEGLQGKTGSSDIGVGSEATQTSDNGMAPPKERRASRGSIHPGGATSLIKDAFGATRRSSTKSDWTGTPLPETVSIPEFRNYGKMDELPEDTTGGLPLEEKNPDRDNLFFRDNKRRIDLIMVYEEETVEVGPLPEMEHSRLETRKEFHQNLEKQGLELELEDKQVSFDHKTFFLKIHVPWKLLTRYAEIMNIKMPIKT